ncbi:putative lipid II flippase FtsW [Paenibacillus popilliae]|uniref:Probable peptidoglycan glycosyltransferase FtsW n=1 Tax=Paenibacillus popilliae TaxID=78057 RepID=A0ABY3APL9_PAEPP|nr:putative lipid II flippase FtsW [Paenibacillus sp. SDF0028]TQR44462.1 putative lipid II flippase FtsW [Paenibacillus sp. SDF0028]
MKIRRTRPDFLLLLLTVLLVSFGIMMTFSASSYTALQYYKQPWYFVDRQLGFACVGFVLMLLFMCIPYPKLKKLSVLLVFGSIATLLLVLLIGKDVNGARRWLMIGGFTIQPTEFIKLFVLLYASILIARKGDKIRSFKLGLLPLLFVVGCIALLILKQPDFGSSLLIIIVTGVLIYVGGAKLSHLRSILLGLAPIIIFLAVFKSYRLKRITSFMNPWDDPDGSGYQLIQSLYAVSHGGIAGTGFGQSIQKMSYLPEAHTDFIFSIIAEEWGLSGTICFLLLYFLFLARGLLVALRCNEPFGLILGTGIISMIGIQLVMNIGAATGFLPITGIPLPFISYGGSSLIVCMTSVGMLLNISRYTYETQQAQSENIKRKTRFTHERKIGAY